MNEDTYFNTGMLRANEIDSFLSHYGRDLVDWTVSPTAPGMRAFFVVTARFTDNYGDVEDGAYVPFSEDSWS